jgi:hypothetical protein|tara:strand:- start:278 stop:487 length:210 start_codon:yes stop_codon:yes gene_type:complete
MPAHNVNTAALEMVLEAAQRFEKLTETLNLTPVDTEDFSLSTAVLMMERVLEVADGNANTVALPEEREH